MTKTLIIDNFDSFTYNLVQYVGELQGNPICIRNNETSISEIQAISPSHIILSPGPGDPRKKEYFGICKEIIAFSVEKNIPLLGVCLGHQGIADFFGADITLAPEVMHGKRSMIEHTNDELYANIPSPLEAMRYHSLVVSQKNFPEELEITAHTKKDQLIMGIRHRAHPIWGIQFHPESIGTKNGKEILKNFLSQNG